MKLGCRCCGRTHLSDSDRKLLTMLDRTNDQLAVEFNRAHATMKNRVCALMGRYGARSRAGLVVLAAQAGDIDITTLRPIR
jgi:DNA-binding NarL/FixJ family response regulator